MINPSLNAELNVLEIYIPITREGLPPSMATIIVSIVGGAGRPWGKFADLSDVIVGRTYFIV